MGVELVDGEVMEDVDRPKHDRHVVAGRDGDLVGIEREVVGGHGDLDGTVGDKTGVAGVVVGAAGDQEPGGEHYDNGDGQDPAQRALLSFEVIRRRGVGASPHD